ncbi:hypothetical protein [Angustibacter aerolatus]
MFTATAVNGPLQLRQRNAGDGGISGQSLTRPSTRPSWTTWDAGCRCSQLIELTPAGPRVRHAEEDFEYEANGRSYLIGGESNLLLRPGHRALHLGYDGAEDGMSVVGSRVVVLEGVLEPDDSHNQTLHLLDVDGDRIARRRHFPIDVDSEFGQAVLIDHDHLLLFDGGGVHDGSDETSLLMDLRTGRTEPIGLPMDQTSQFSAPGDGTITTFDPVTHTLDVFRLNGTGTVRP